MKNLAVFCASTSVLLASFTARAQLAPTSDDLWDVSRGTLITGQSSMEPCPVQQPMDARDIFGGNFSACPSEAAGNAVFNDAADGFTHFVEWATPDPVTIRSFNLWAAGDGDTQLREMASFRLLAKSAGSTSFDLVVFSFTPSHPYRFVNGVQNFLISTDVKPVTARAFRAEFVNRAEPKTGALWGPRILELDGFDTFLGPRAAIRVSEVEVSWESVAGLKYQVEYREDVPGGNWTALGSVVVGDGSVMRMKDVVPPSQPRRFYRVRATE